ncbi:unnamed protein product [Ambrosiozyma monospora]|uniref:Unnamed protein product n=1 Tax=Ambrosiozyma monospora TaxID=43982 RepID=A0ACB5TDN1_AMBMO|nr:unnamed protein product [Ambrosiozyma monospora]
MKVTIEFSLPVEYRKKGVDILTNKYLEFQSDKYNRKTAHAEAAKRENDIFHKSFTVYEYNSGMSIIIFRIEHKII